VNSAPAHGGIRPDPAMGDPPAVHEGDSISVIVEGSGGSVLVGILGDPTPPQTLSLEEIEANGGSIPLPLGATAGQIVYVTMLDEPFTSFLVEVLGAP
jgi:hypothetical protein